MDINKFVAEKIKYYRTKNDLKQEDLARHLGVSSETISRYENGERKTNYDTLISLSELFKIPISNFFPSYENAEYMDVTSNTLRIPVLGVIKAGIPIEAQEDIIDYVYIPKIWSKGENEFYALKISGDSMSPKYNDSDIVIFKQTNDPIEANKKDCSVMVNCTECTFKKVFIDEDGITLQPYNTDYEAMRFTKKEVINLPITIVGIAVEKRVKV